MKKNENYFFEKFIKHVNNRNVSKAYKALIKVYETVENPVYFQNKGSLVFEELLDIWKNQTHPDSEKDYKYYLILGFLNVQKKFKDEYNLLTSIEFNPDDNIDLPYHLLSQTASEKALRYAEISVIINPCARNYFALSKLVKNEKPNAYNLELSYLNRAIQHNSKDSMVFARRGEILFELKRYPEAIKDFKKSIRLNEYNCAYLGLCKSLYEIGKFSASNYIIGEALWKDKDQTGSYFHQLGMNYTALQNYEKAQIYLEESLVYQPNNEAIAKEIKHVQELMDQKKERKNIEQLEIDDSFPF